MFKVLVACEESQAVCKAFRARGAEAYSCDIQPCSGGHPEWHVQGDALALLQGGRFVTADGAPHDVAAWDLLIAHPPCTYLTCARAVRLYDKAHNIKNPERYQKGLDAAQFFMTFWNAPVPRIAVENPVPMSVFGLPRPSQKIEPYTFGDAWRKRTCLWLKGLPPLIPHTAPVEPLGLWVGATSARRDPMVHYRYILPSNRDQKRRSKTFPGIARAMAEQWLYFMEAQCQIR